MKSVTERLKRAFKKHDIRTYSKPGFTVEMPWSALRTFLSSISAVVSEIGRSFGKSTEEHAKSLERGDIGL